MCISWAKTERAVCAVLAILAANSAAAVPLNPGDFTSLGSLRGEALAIDTGALTLNGAGGGALFPQGAGLPDIAVFAFDGGSILGDVTVTGANPLAILFQGAGTIAGSIDLTPFGTTPTIGVAGGGNGGFGSFLNAEDGAGPGAGLGGLTSANRVGGGSGAGFGSPGGSSGAGVSFRAGGPTYGDPLANALQAGSGGGASGSGNRFPNATNGGGGGGALEIGALTSLLFSGAFIIANGGDGSDASAGSGGGSGGGLLFHAFDISIDVSSLITANGGDAGRMGQALAGGCGGAGRIAFLHNPVGSFSNAGTVEATSGDSGIADDFCNPLEPVNIVSVTADASIGMVGGSQPTAIPAPAALPLFLAGLAGLALATRWRRAAAPSLGRTWRSSVARGAGTPRAPSAVRSSRTGHRRAPPD